MQSFINSATSGTVAKRPKLVEKNVSEAITTAVFHRAGFKVHMVLRRRVAGLPDDPKGNAVLIPIPSRGVLSFESTTELRPTYRGVFLRRSSVGYRKPPSADTNSEIRSRREGRVQGRGRDSGGGGEWGICPSWGNPRMTEDVDGSSHEAEGFWTPLVGRINGVGSDLDGHRLTEQSR
eukprot:scaffold221_cov351-Pavlova_lutheri.AAC.35